MSNIGNGYGSEYQLLRLLGRHRNEFDEKIKECLACSEQVFWMDFNRSGLLDREIMNMDFIPNQEVPDEWRSLWPTNDGRNGINWDAIGKVGDKILLVEAKAHAKELEQKMAASNPHSIQMIRDAFSSLCIKYNVTLNDNWYKIHYQLANHLVAVNFLREKGIDAYLVNIYFINGFQINAHGKELKQSKSITSREEWELVIRRAHDNLGITGTKIEDLIRNIFIDC